jgi:hypothetical protein
MMPDVAGMPIRHETPAGPVPDALCAGFAVVVPRPGAQAAGRVTPAGRAGCGCGRGCAGSWFVFASWSASWYRCSLVRSSSPPARPASASSTVPTMLAHSGVRSPWMIPAPWNVIWTVTDRSSKAPSGSRSGSSGRHRALPPSPLPSTPAERDGAAPGARRSPRPSRWSLRHAAARFSGLGLRAAGAGYRRCVSSRWLR